MYAPYGTNETKLGKFFVFLNNESVAYTENLSGGEKYQKFTRNEIHRN